MAENMKDIKADVDLLKNTVKNNYYISLNDSDIIRYIHTMPFALRQEVLYRVGMVAWPSEPPTLGFERLGGM